MTQGDFHSAFCEEPHVRERNPRGPGRPRAIDQAFFETVSQLYESGLGYRSIANELWRLNCFTTHTTVRRLLKRQGAYSDARVANGSK